MSAAWATIVISSIPSASKVRVEPFKVNSIESPRTTSIESSPSVLQTVSWEPSSVAQSSVDEDTESSRRDSRGSTVSR